MGVLGAGLLCREAVAGLVYTVQVPDMVMERQHAEAITHLVQAAALPGASRPASSNAHFDEGTLRYLAVAGGHRGSRIGRAGIDVAVVDTLSGSLGAWASPCLWKPCRAGLQDSSFS